MGIFHYTPQEMFRFCEDQFDVLTFEEQLEFMDLLLKHMNRED